MSSCVPMHCNILFLHRPSSVCFSTINGPPLSPWHASILLFRSRAHSFLSLILTEMSRSQIKSIYHLIMTHSFWTFWTCPRTSHCSPPWWPPPSAPETWAPGTWQRPSPLQWPSHPQTENFLVNNMYVIFSSELENLHYLWSSSRK